MQQQTLTSALDQLGISESNLSPDLLNYINALTDIAVLLDIETPSMTDINIALAHHQNAFFNREMTFSTLSERKLLIDESRKLAEQKMSNLEIINENLQGAATLMEQETSRMEQIAWDNMQKSEKIDQEINEMQQKLAQRGYTGENSKIAHKTIVDDKEKLKIDIHLAQVEIAKARDRLQQLAAEVEQKITASVSLPIPFLSNSDTHH
ncbi:MAG: hypothetical protein EZS28_000525 [Streblomastix strix]|uniref:Uncharacterized protein n=1 Tax=Streblomastix strix TaxID=222440 RepID=A0A5J4XBQ3_9EUKA|nr:MAG: hypothetical protein EZS28_000525 [Streblomastix strix]